MIPKECKRLAEVDFPIAAVGKAVLRREKKFPVPRGLPSTLHHWWARRPLGSTRAIMLALLLPDPCDPLCPESFKQTAWQLLRKVQGILGSDCLALRSGLIKFIGNFADWDFSVDRAFLEVSRGLIKAAHSGRTPYVVDPFAGGGAIPLEALRLGCDILASELNPVACLILKAIIESIPRYGFELRERFEHIAGEVNGVADNTLSPFYPPGPNGDRPLAYLWARTVRCESPNCGAEIPLVRSFWLCNKGGRKRAVRYAVVRVKGSTPYIEFSIFEPLSDTEVPSGSVRLAKAACLACNFVLLPVRVRDQLRQQRGGADVIFSEAGERIGGARLWAIVSANPNGGGRQYRLPTSQDYKAIFEAQLALGDLIRKQTEEGRSAIPVETTPQDGTGSVGGGYRTRKYGIANFGDFFTARQKLALAVYTKNIAALYKANTIDGAVAELLALAIDKVADFNCSLSTWRVSSEDFGHLFSRQALPMVWDFAETSLIGPSYMDFGRAVDHVKKVIDFVVRSTTSVGQVQVGDARKAFLPDSSCDLYFTDPPYYDSVPYADLADFFFVWLKRALPNHPLLKDPLDPGNPLTPKTEEITRDEISHLDGRPKKDAAFYEDGMKTAFGAGRRVVREDGIGCIIFAHKTTEGWEALLAGIIRGGWVVTASWPIATEMSSRMRARESAALATSVHLVCRPRTQNNIGDWGEVLRELPRRVKDWMERLQSEGIRGADLVFACIGPALEIYNMGGSIPPEIWNRLGTKLIPKLRSGGELTARVSFSVLLDRKAVAGFEAELRQILEDLGLEAKIQIEKL